MVGRRGGVTVGRPEDATGAGDDDSVPHSGGLARSLSVLRSTLADGSPSNHFLAFGAALLLVTALAVLLYDFTGPLDLLDPDTTAYVAVAHRYLAGNFAVDAARLPGYPLLLAAVFALAGRDNLSAASAVQAGLFMLGVLALYALLCLLFRRAVPAFLVALLAGVNAPLISYTRPVLSEALALLLVTLLALAVALYIRMPGPHRLWLVALCLFALFMTRPEWLYVPVPLLAYLLLVAWRRRCAPPRRLLLHGLAALVVLYGTVALYVRADAAQNGCATVTYVQNFNLLGKVMQYRMQDEAPARDAAVTRALDAYLAAGGYSPWQFVGQAHDPSLEADCEARVGDYGRAVILGHPVEYLARSVPIAAQTLTDTTPFRPLPPDAPAPLVALSRLGDAITYTFLLVPPLALLYWLLLLPRRGRLRELMGARPTVFAETMAALALLACYGLALTALGSYAYYPRLRTPYEPLLIAVVYGTAAACIPRLARRLRRKRPAMSSAAISDGTGNLAGLGPHS